MNKNETGAGGLENEIDVSRHLFALWRAKWLIAIGIVLAASVTAYVGLSRPPQYTASALIKVGRVWKEPIEDIYQTVEIANDRGFLDEAARRTGRNARALVRGVRAEPVTGGPRRIQYPVLVRVVARASSQEEALDLVGAVAGEIVARHQRMFEEALAPRLKRQARLEAILERPSPSPDLKAQIEGELDEVRAGNESPTSTEPTHLVEKPAAGPVSLPTPWRAVASAGLIAALVGVAAALVVGHFAAGRNQAR